MYYISTDATLTSANLHSALASVSDDDLEDALGGNLGGGSREEMITKYLMVSPFSSWKWLAAGYFYQEKEKALDEVKKHFKRKLGTSMMTIIHKSYLLVFIIVCP